MSKITFILRKNDKNMSRMRFKIDFSILIALLGFLIIPISVFIHL